MHPGTGGALVGTGSSNLGASVRYQAAADGLYHVVGGFARDNENFNAGNGVDVLVTTGSLDMPLYAETIGAANVVDLDEPFSGTGVAMFDLVVPMLAGQSISFVVFSDGQGQDGTFDTTAFRATITQVPEPPTALLVMLGAALLLPVSLRRGTLSES